MSLLVGQLGEFYRGLVGRTKRRHVADRQGAGAQCSGLNVYFITSF